MRRRPLALRCGAAILSVWLTLVVGEPGIVHACRMHGDAKGVPAATAPVHDLASTDAQHGGHQGHAALEHSAATTPESTQPAHDHHDCTCIGCCAGGPSTAVVPGAPSVQVPTATVEVAVVDAPMGMLPRPGPRHSRPYPTGPPRV
jgi:hypothetical protein